MHHAATKDALLLNEHVRLPHAERARWAAVGVSSLSLFRGYRAAACLAHVVRFEAAKDGLHFRLDRLLDGAPRRSLLVELHATLLRGVVGFRLGVELGSNAIGNVGTEALATACSRGACPRLKTLSLRSNGIHNGGVVALAPCALGRAS